MSNSKLKEKLQRVSDLTTDTKSRCVKVDHSIEDMGHVYSV